MTEGLFYAHSGLRYLVLLAGIAALLYYGYALAARRPVERPARVVGAAFAGLLDLQVVLGLLLMATGIYYPALMGHLMMMLLAVAVVHGTGAFARRIEEPRRYHTIRFFGVFLALVLVAGGILSIGRSILGSGAPSTLG